ncbi:cyclic nucleotide-binding domain-containing protein [Myxococcus sp. CA033]|uniref:cyclic nucleotide-binding domain-containing protein n=1 Tax=Myxococcus sp. CA033 TaxID=2741516 RepID=UPI00157B8CF4|nr:cyclic nucleotide-binding domain-containing protein [Myxococcus sp. CA033]NTX36640.1 cyclic nucleotide-binding domain-containing protein [Myxococcus sp. CA033]
MEARKLKDRAAEAFTKGRFSKAAELYEDFCKLDPKDHQSRLRTGDAWAKAGERERAISAYQAAAEGFAKEGFLPRAIAASKLILELDPSHQGVQQMLANLYARRGTPAGARARGPMTSALSAPPPPERPVAAVPTPPRAGTPAVLEAGEGSVNPSAELPAELALSVEDAPTPGSTDTSEEVVHSVSMGLSHPDAGASVAAASPGEEHEGIDIALGEPESSPAVSAVTHANARSASETPSVASVSVISAGMADTHANARGASAASPAASVSAISAGVADTHANARSASDASINASVGTIPAGAVVTSAHARGEAASAPAAVSAETSIASAQENNGTSLPPGLAPRATQRVRPPVPETPVAASTDALTSGPRSPVSGKWKALSSPIGEAGSTDSATMPRTPTVIDPPSAPPGLRPRRAEATPHAGATAVPFREVSRELGASLRAVPPSPSSFTELEMEADSLLHAVELAAQAGLHQRAEEVGDGEEEVFSLTEEVLTDAPSLDALPTIPLFSDLPRDAFIELFERCPLRRFSLGERILDQGSHGDAFYVICEGQVRVFRTESGRRVDLAALEGGAFFGEMAILSGAPRTASVEAGTEDTQLLEISAPVLASLSRSHPQVAAALKKFVRQRLLTNVMNTSALFRPFNRKDRRTLVERFRARDIERGEVVIRDGDRTDGLYVLLSGEVEVHKDGHLLTRLKEGDLFGEISLLQKTPATATVTAARHTTLLRLPREDFDALISSHPQILVLISELSDERLRRTEQVLGTNLSGTLNSLDGEEELILV